MEYRYIEDCSIEVLSNTFHCNFCRTGNILAIPEYHYIKDHFIGPAPLYKRDSSVLFCFQHSLTTNLLVLSLLGPLASPNEFLCSIHLSICAFFASERKRLRGILRCLQGKEHKNTSLLVQLSYLHNTKSKSVKSLV